MKPAVSSCASGLVSGANTLYREWRASFRKQSSAVLRALIALNRSQVWVEVCERLRQIDAARSTRVERVHFIYKSLPFGSRIRPYRVDLREVSVSSPLGVPNVSCVNPVTACGCTAHLLPIKDTAKLAARTASNE